MNKALITIFFSVLCVVSYAQQLKLEISNPQPRVGERFTISVDIDTLSALFFKSFTGKFKISESSGDAIVGYPKLIASAEATETGKNVIGPYKFEFNGKKYTTNKVSFEVVDSLPAVDKGLWIRMVKIDDTTFHILIDQRMSSHPSYNPGNNSLKWSTQQDSSRAVSTVDNIENVKSNGCSTSNGPGFLPGEGLENGYSYFFADCEFVVIDKKKPVVLHRSDFKNLPPDFKFEDIIVN